jgi:hypothetical protein
LAADVRPPLPPPPPVPGEAIAGILHAGDPGVGEPFIAGWSRVATAVDDAAGVVRSVADNLPWDSPVATRVVRAHLVGFADRLELSAARARSLAYQAGQHAEQAVQARRDIPAPAEFDGVNRQLQVVAQANARSGGAYAIPLAQLTARKAQLETKAVQGYSAYHATTDSTTAGDAGSADMGDGELASVLPGMIPTVLGAAGGLVGGALSTIAKVPEALVQAGTQAAGAATQGLSGLMAPKLDSGASASGDGAGAGDPATRDGIGDAGGGDTAPAAGGPGPMAPPVMPSTGHAPTPPTMPSGSPPEPVQPSGGGASMMPMGMPLGGMMPGAVGRAGGQKDAVRPKKVVVPPTPHTESVTGKVSADRIAVSGTASEPPDPASPGEDGAPRLPGPVIRRVTTARPRDDAS